MFSVDILVTPLVGVRLPGGSVGTSPSLAGVLDDRPQILKLGRTQGDQKEGPYVLRCHPSVRPATLHRNTFSIADIQSWDLSACVH